METLTTKISMCIFRSVLFYCLLLTSCQGQHSLKISPLHPFIEIDTLTDGNNICIRHTSYFTINRNISDSVEIKYAVDSLIKSHSVTHRNNYCLFYLLIYKETKKLNSGFISDNNDHPELNSKDLLIEIELSHEGQLQYSYFKNGRLLNPFKDVRLVPVE